MKKEEYVKALRELAEFVEKTDLPDQVKDFYGEKVDSFDPPKLFLYLRSKPEFVDIVSKIGAYEKTKTGGFVGVKKILPSGASMMLDIHSEQICKKVKVGTRIVPAREEEIIPAEPEQEEDVYEWQCPESFNALKEEVGA